MSTQRNQSKLVCTLGAQHNEYHTKIDIAHPGNKKSTLTITLERTRRVFCEGQTAPTAPPIGTLPLYDVNKNAYQANMLEDMKRAGGIFLPLSMVDAIRLKFEATEPFAIKVIADGRNAISGFLSIVVPGNMFTNIKLEDAHKSQDYIVVSGQTFLDGARTSPVVGPGVYGDENTFKQFVAIPHSNNDSNRFGVINSDEIGNLQFQIIPIKQGNANLNVPGNTAQSKVTPYGQFFGAGFGKGSSNQLITIDNYDPNLSDESNGISFHVHVLNIQTFTAITGHIAPFMEVEDTSLRGRLRKLSLNAVFYDPDVSLVKQGKMTFTAWKDLEQETIKWQMQQRDAET